MVKSSNDQAWCQHTLLRQLNGLQRHGFVETNINEIIIWNLEIVEIVSNNLFWTIFDGENQRNNNLPPRDCGAPAGGWNESGGGSPDSRPPSAAKPVGTSRQRCSRLWSLPSWKQEKSYLSGVQDQSDCGHLLTVTKRLFVWVSWWMRVPKKCWK